ncbi:hypothetical protein DOTSEDRAFT_97113, partial [Dothistroma septosporum NZE10]
NYVRILQLNPATHINADIHCSIEAAPVTTAEHDALSYSWGMKSDGDASLSRSTSINEKSARVTRNLFKGLRRIRGRRDPARFWIDAVCI